MVTCLKLRTSNKINFSSVANLAALGCVRFCFLTFVVRKIRLFSERTRTREINCFFLRKRTNTVKVVFLQNN